jgi:hypothetical protein
MLTRFVGADDDSGDVQLHHGEILCTDLNQVSNPLLTNSICLLLSC